MNVRIPIGAGIEVFLGENLFYTTLKHLEHQFFFLFHQRLVVSKPPVSILGALPCTQQRGLRSKSRLRLEKDVASHKWAKLIEEHNANKTSSDEPKEPHEIHIVHKSATLYGRPYWEKDVMKKLGFQTRVSIMILHLDRRVFVLIVLLFGKVSKVLVRNTPYWNDLLREVKHLVRIQPLTFPHGVPQNEVDYERSYINCKGEMVVRHTLHPTEEATVPKEEPSKWQLKGLSVKKVLRRKLDLHQVNTEYYEPEYKWKLNEDGKEYRYTHNKGVRKYKHHF